MPPTITDDHGQQLLGSVADPDKIKDRDRGKKPDKMAEKDDQHADMEQDRPHDKLLAPQQLGRG
jgi:hypothetical protein